MAFLEFQDALKTGEHKKRAKNDAKGNKVDRVHH